MIEKCPRTRTYPIPYPAILGSWDQVKINGVDMPQFLLGFSTNGLYLGQVVEAALDQLALCLAMCLNAITGHRDIHTSEKLIYTSKVYVLEIFITVYPNFGMYGLKAVPYLSGIKPCVNALQADFSA